jgi:hypothetical protein
VGNRGDLAGRAIECSERVLRAQAYASALFKELERKLQEVPREPFEVSLVQEIGAE